MVTFSNIAVCSMAAPTVLGVQLVPGYHMKSPQNESTFNATQLK